MDGRASDSSPAAAIRSGRRPVVRARDGRLVRGGLTGRPGSDLARSCRALIGTSLTEAPSITGTVCPAEHDRAHFPIAQVSSDVPAARVAFELATDGP